MICETCAVRELREARLDGLKEAIRAMCPECSDGDTPTEGRHVRRIPIACMAWPIHRVAAAALKEELQG